MKILNKDFLYLYELGKITSEKLVENFGQPQRKYKNLEYENLIFEFENAKLEIVNDINSNSIIALTVFSKLDNEHPINCRLSFEEDDEIFGKAKISDVIINNCFFLESYNSQLGAETIIGTRNNYRQTRHLKYYYLISGNFDKIETAKNQIINQVCVTQVDDVFSFFNFSDTFYN